MAQDVVCLGECSIVALKKKMWILVLSGIFYLTKSC